MKTALTHPSPHVVPINGDEIRKEYGLTPAQAKKAVAQMSGLYAKRKAAGKIIKVKGKFNESHFD